MALTRGEQEMLDAQASLLIRELTPAQEKLRKRDTDKEGKERYAQLPPTHRTVPAGLVAPDNLTSKKSHRAEGWLEAILEGAVVPAVLRGAFAIHEYRFPSRAGGVRAQIPGWFVEGRASDGTVIYRRVYDGGGPRVFATLAWVPE